MKSATLPVLATLMLAGCAGQGGLGVTSLSLDSLLGGMRTAAPQPVAEIQATACDREAAAEDDSQRAQGVVPVKWDDLKASAAIAACEQALLDHPGHPRLLYQLGRGYQKAYRYADAAAANRQAAAAGYTYAVYTMGWFHEQGYGVPRDLGMAESWYRKAAAMGHGAAWKNIGQLYLVHDENRNLDKAADAFAHPAKAGDPVAMGVLAYVLRERDGRGDKERALDWSVKAAQAGNTTGMLLAGHYYNDRKDRQSALRWYQQAADKGQPTAMYMVGQYWHYGLGVPKDTRRALQYYERAANEGFATAAVQAAMIHAKGDGVPKDERKAMHWLQAGAPSKPAAIQEGRAP
ncbi:tetratricopeptide repeat protein [Orrella sp. JC864]|uniref:tetratricopeptide repeat protein n=1 Tax=Orrella sp. JC864 TaxID=3120298 RepID=UPI00300A74F9